MQGKGFSNGTVKIKVVWLCYFSNQFIQNKIKPWKRVNEFAPWISNLIPLFENDAEIELHIVSQHRWISGYKSFKSQGVTYHFFNAGLPFIGRHWPGFFRFDVWTGFIINKLIVSRIVKKISPDIIHLHGAENEFSTAISQFHDKYPVFITIQGFINGSFTKSLNTSIKTKNEVMILKTFNHFGYRTQTMGEDLKALNNKAILHWHHYPMKEIRPVEGEKQFDLVFFSRVSREKGIEDLLRAISIIKKEKPDISLCVIGGGKLKIWRERAKELGIVDNVNWVGFLQTQDDVHKMASTAKISVLPTYNEIISGTIIESLFLKLPVVAYNVGSIHEVNEQENIISLVEKFDINGLAESILLLLNNENLQKEIAEKGYLRANEMFNTERALIRADLIKAYIDVITDFTKDKNISKSYE